MSNRLQLDPHCLIFFVDETGHENFADPNYPVFGFGGCAVMAGAMEQVIRKPWRALKAAHFGGSETPLHAAELRDPTPEQLSALGQFFLLQPFGRFAVIMTASTALPSDADPLEILPAALRKRWVELASRTQPKPREFALLHEASERGDPLVERYFRPTVAHVEGQQIKVHHGLMDKSSDEGLEVADFIVQAAGRQALVKASRKKKFRRDFKAIFHANSLWSSYLAIDSVVAEH